MATAMRSIGLILPLVLCLWSAATTTAQLVNDKYVIPTDISVEEQDLAKVFRSFLEDVDSFYFTENDASLSRVEMEHAVLERLLALVNMDPTLIDQRPLKYNWMEELHLKTLALAPSSFWKVYLRPPSQEEFDSIINLDTFAQERSEDLKDLRRFAFAPHRDRGMVSALSVSFSSMVLQTIQHYVGYATPTNSVLEELANKYTPIIEVGAGNGYWSAALELSKNSEDDDDSITIAYDSKPPITKEEDEKNPNLFSHVTTPYLPVQEGSCSDVMVGDDIKQRTLLMIWPNNPDYLDNPTHHYEGSDALPIWDVDCLKAYLQAGGTTVIYVGERESRLQVRRDFAPDVGMSSSKQFQTILQEKFTMVEQYDIPVWWGVDDVTVWKKKEEVDESKESSREEL